MKKLLKSRLFWALSYELRRSVFKALYPGVFADYQQRRIADADQWQGSLSGFDKLKCIFIHIPKSAGVTVNRTLFNNLGGGHASIKEYALVFAENEFSRYYKFTFVRNPYERLYSAFVFLKNGGFHRFDKQWAEYQLDGINSFDDFVHNWLNRESMYQAVHFIPQFEFISINGRISVDDVFRTETYDEDMSTICERLGIRFVKGMRENVTSNKPNIELRPAVARKIEKLYSLDFELFEYSKASGAILLSAGHNGGTAARPFRKRDGA